MVVRHPLNSSATLCYRDGMSKLLCVDLSIPNAKAFWSIVVSPSVEAFRANATTYTALMAAWSLWHMLEWHWYDSHPDEDYRTSPAHKAFDAIHTADCPDLRLLRDVAEASQHRVLGRKSVTVERLTPSRGHGVNAVVAYGSGVLPFYLYCDDGTSHWIGDVIDRATTFWETRVPRSPKTAEPP